MMRLAQNRVRAVRRAATAIFSCRAGVGKQFDDPRRLGFDVADAFEETVHARRDQFRGRRRRWWQRDDAASLCFQAREPKDSISLGM